MDNERSRGKSPKALLRLGSLATLIAATYPFALLGQFTVDSTLGDAEMLREFVHGYRRVLAAAMLGAWAASLVWVAAFWVLAECATRFLPPAARAVGLVAVLAFTAASVAKLIVVPAMFGWLALATLTLHAAYRCACGRFMQEST